MKKHLCLGVALMAFSVVGVAVGAGMQMPAAIPVTQPITLTMRMNVPQEASQTSDKTPAVATGAGVFLFNPSTDALVYTIVYTGLSGDPTMAHFHLGASTTNGPIAQTLCGKPAPLLNGPCPKSTSGVFAGTWQVPKDRVKDLLQGDIYVNVHTTLNPDGEIRGQIHPN